ncbi:ventricular zone-expressed PH domain-containing protein homolog 1-like isoform X1 [Polyodon spathula]|uniref:ventricular zone-expressed PH domain-containing protein homolog 1-like isoform X1 n=1 Tax=Polyodon spathula TaxID=7913 RepID=UPI001B7F2690|nr:ventricular zone-expressed PH domain-containing protein homolog 1-like isoform X1 [Polyodon spathula]XP_041126195.1 ventricular zone-expressed PH domain-containing protein homolog 1-like isoform X1 [Polyodon spathula]
MHHLFSLVLGQRDLSRAGDLFSLKDTEIEDSLSEALEEIKTISSSADYLTNDNDQAVVEICITRITTAIRETRSIEKHGLALVSLWESCLEYNLKPEGKDEDTPHAKIASDIMSCILQNYKKPAVMALAVPVAVKFLCHGNKELCRNMSSYLSLAAIAKADLLADHTEAITKSILQANYMLLRVLPSVYEKQPQSINTRIPELVELMPRLEQPEQQHLLRLLQMVAKQHPQVLNKSVSSLISYLHDPNQNDSVLNILLEMSLTEPAAVASFLPNLKAVGEDFPNLLGQIAKIYGAVGHVDEERARSCLLYLVTLLASMEHTFHHTLLLEIKGITDTFSSILGAYSKDIYRMSNSFSAIAKLLVKKLESDNTPSDRTGDETKEAPKSCDLASAVSNGDENEKLQVRIQAFEETLASESNSPGPIRRYSQGQASKEEREEMRFNRSKSLALHAVRTQSVNSENGHEQEHGEMPPGFGLSERSLSQESCRLPLGSDRDVNTTEAPSSPHSCAASIVANSSAEAYEDSPTVTEKCTGELQDQLFLHLKENLGTIQTCYAEMVKRIPVPEQCLIEDSFQSCVAKLFFTCSMKGHYCLYSKSSFTLNSRQPQVWIQIMLLFQQGLSSEPLSSEDKTVQLLKSMWKKTQLKGTHSFETAIIQSTFPQKKDLDNVQKHLKEVRFFDFFGYSEETGGWLCFMCNNPEKVTVVTLDGQPLIEGKLKEKQVRWKFIKRWKTRYFTLAGNQLFFRKGKSKDDLDDSPIELSKVQSVKVVARKRRDRSLPRAFEIFTDNKTYVLKAKDEKKAEEWLQCINVAVAQAKERESREATTYL